MAYDHTVQIKLTNIQAQLSNVNSQFLSKLSSSDLRSLLDKVTQLESNIRAELRNVSKK